MTGANTVYAEALYDLAKDEGLATTILEELKTLDQAFSTEKAYLKLLSTPNLSVQERTGILDEGFRGKVHPYTLNFLKILTEKGYIRGFHDSVSAYRNLHNEDNGILPVKVVTAKALDASQTNRLKFRLSTVTGKAVEIINTVDPACIGGIRLDYDGKRVEDTVASRLEAVRKLLKNTIL